MREATLAGCVVVGFTLAILSPSALAQNKVTLTERDFQWSAIPFDASAGVSVALSEDAKHGAYVTQVNGKFRVMLDGEPVDGDHDAVAADSFAFGGARFAYAAKRGEHWIVFADHEAGDPYDAIVGQSLRFSPGANHVAYIAVRDKKTYVVVDGHRDAACDSVEGNHVTFAPSGERLAYVAKRNERTCLVLDGKDGPPFDEVGRPVFSPDNAHVAYAARSGVRWFVLLDGQSVVTTSTVLPGTLALSDDGKRMVYAVRTAAGMQLVEGDRLGEAHDWIFDGSATFSADGKRLAYAVRHHGGCAVVVDDKQGKSFDGVVPTSISFSDDGKRVAYVAEVVQEKKVRRRVVVDDNAQPAFADVRGVPQFSPNGVHVAYIAERDDRRQCVVVDGTPGSPYAFIRGVPAFSPDSQHVGVVALGGDDRFELGEEFPADPVQAVGGRLVLDRSMDLQLILRRQKSLGHTTMDQNAWTLQPLDMRLVDERISVD